MEQLYRIGLFSKMNKVTIKTLRFYDEMDIFKPAFIDPETNYRYYSSEQITILHKILALKQLGCSISEIKQIQEGMEVNEILMNKKIELIEEVNQKANMLAQIEYYLNNDDIKQEYDVIIKTLPQVVVASHRRVIANYGALFKFYPYLGEKMFKMGCEISEPEYCFNIYHDGGYQEEDIDVEMCQSVVEAKENTEEITFKEIPEVAMAACVLHQGPYSNLREAYQKLINWIEKNNYLIIDNPRESYIDGIWNKDNEDDWLTEIQIPIAKK